MKELDAALAHFAQIAERDCGKQIKEQPGAGAAGGMGGGLLLLPNVQLKAGVQIVLDNLKLAEQVKDADLVITGEGRMDAQSILGKTLSVWRTRRNNLISLSLRLWVVCVRIMKWCMNMALMQCFQLFVIWGFTDNSQARRSEFSFNSSKCGEIVVIKISFSY